MSKQIENTAELLTYTKSTNDISITVAPQYLKEQSQPEQSIYAFAYTVAMENLSDVTVQLLSRHWLVHSGGLLYTEVKGEGVVGEQPVLQPGDIFQYSSGSVIKDPVGSMHGTYTFKFFDDRGSYTLYDVMIPHFDLMCPYLIH